MGIVPVRPTAPPGRGRGPLNAFALPGNSVGPAEYNKTVMDHFQRPRNAGELETPDAAGVATRERCGDLIKLTLRLRRGRIEAIRFQAYGSPAMIACGSALTELAAGKGTDEAAAITPGDLAKVLGELPEAKSHCPDLAVEALKDALA